MGDEADFESPSRSLRRKTAAQGQNPKPKKQTLTPHNLIHHRRRRAPLPRQAVAQPAPARERRVVRVVFLQVRAPRRQQSEPGQARKNTEKGVRKEEERERHCSTTQHGVGRVAQCETPQCEYKCE
jgi:hypothetical protein